MKSLFWNIRGIANHPSRLALKRLITSHKPDLIFIAKPWMLFENFPSFWLHRLGLKLFAVNNRGNLNPNLWCLCSNHLHPSILDIDDQQISFSISDNQLTFGFNVVYASTNYLLRRNLWSKLHF